jgi:SAM-dependent methyltransferase/methyltransferase-like protein
MPPTSYDTVPYTSLSLPQTHPDRLATLAHLFGLVPPPLMGCRVLELGCASGGNLIPLAEQIPGVQCVGVDLSTVQIAEGQRTLAALGYNQVRLVAASLSDVDATFGEFDYILCHGVFSWVPPAVQEDILRICRERLAEGGVAYVSYNTLPGWRMRGMIRDLMRQHALGFPTPELQIQQARAMLDFLAEAVPPSTDPAYSALLRQELETLRLLPDSYIFHEHLEDVNEPVYFREFVQRAAKHGLKYLAEADFVSMLASRFQPQVTQTVQRIAPDIIGQEQLMDFLCNRSFRQSLLIRDTVRVDRSIPSHRIEGLWLASLLQPLSATPVLTSQQTEEFQADNGTTISSGLPLTKAALLVLSKHGPLPIAWHHLLEEAMTLLDRTPEPHEVECLQADLMRCYSGGLLNLHSLPPAFTLTLSDYPAASPLARLQAKTAYHATSLRHETVSLDEAARGLLCELDGKTSRGELARRFHARFSDVPPTAVDTLLNGLARVGLLLQSA